jgi:hypothetical protein
MACSVPQSALLTRFSDNGVDFKVRTVSLGGENVKLQLWDTAGQERFRAVTKSFNRSTHGFFIAYHITDRRAFDNVREWLQSIEWVEKSNRMLIGTKVRLTAACARYAARRTREGPVTSGTAPPSVHGGLASHARKAMLTPLFFFLLAHSPPPVTTPQRPRFGSAG